MTPSYAVPPPLARDLTRCQRPALGIGAALLAISVLGAFFDPAEFFRSYLMSYLFWIGLALGSLAIVMLQYLTGGAWGVVTRRPLESASRTLPWLALLFIPIALGIPYLYDWAHSDRVANDPVLLHRSGYMSPLWFIVRAIAYFIVWILFTHLLNKRSHEEDQRGDQTR